MLYDVEFASYIESLLAETSFSSNIVLHRIRTSVRPASFKHRFYFCPNFSHNTKMFERLFCFLAFVLLSAFIEPAAASTSNTSSQLWLTKTFRHWWRRCCRTRGHWTWNILSVCLFGLVFSRWFWLSRSARFSINLSRSNHTAFTFSTFSMLLHCASSLTLFQICVLAKDRHFYEWRNFWEIFFVLRRFGSSSI